MVHVQKATLWLAAIFACIGTACIAVYLTIRKPEGYLLLGAAIAAAFSAVSLFVGVIFVCIESARHKRLAVQRVVPSPEPVSNSAVAEQIKQRQQVLGERLNIDEPRFCSQAKAPCTAWSFCGSVPDTAIEKTATHIEERESQNSVSSQTTVHNIQPLPVILRKAKPASCLALTSVAENVDAPEREIDKKTSLR